MVNMENTVLLAAISGKQIEKNEDEGNPWCTGIRLPDNKVFVLLTRELCDFEVWSRETMDIDTMYLLQNDQFVDKYGGDVNVDMADPTNTAVETYLAAYRAFRRGLEPKVRRHMAVLEVWQRRRRNMLEHGIMGALEDAAGDERESRMCFIAACLAGALREGPVE